MKINKYLILLLAVIPLSFGIITFSRYVIKSEHTSFITSNPFYFNSDLLSSNYTLNDWDGTSSYIIPIDLMNYNDDLRWTKKDIVYEASVECLTDKGTLNCSIDNGTLEYDQYYKTIKLVNLNIINDQNINFVKDDVIDLKVTIKSISPYRKVLSNNIKLIINDHNLSYQVIDNVNEEVLKVIISNNSNKKRNVNMSWNNEYVIPDDTNEIFNDYTSSIIINEVIYYNKVSFIMDGNSSKEVLFYKINSSDDYTNSNYININ